MAAFVALGACAGSQSALNPAGPQAARISHLWWFALITATIVYLVVIAFLLYAAFHRRRPEDPSLEPHVGERTNLEAERRMTRWVVGGTVATVIILFVYLIVDFSTGRALAAIADEDEALVIRITGNQWWWNVEYEDPIPSRRLRTANEIHVPVGRPIQLKMSANDVIHSFWVPNLHGKKDLIPGYMTTTWFRADEAGVYSGQCAEFCGHQHANMRFLVVAVAPEEFDAWYEQQLQPAVPPADSLRLRGQEVFLSHACVMCHTIRGTPAGGRTAPELTHLASRRTIAAGTLPNRRGHLAGWILDPQRIKPGNRMPPNQMSSDDLQALLSYLESLR